MTINNTMKEQKEGQQQEDAVDEEVFINLNSKQREKEKQLLKRKLGQAKKWK